MMLRTPPSGNVYDARRRPLHEGFRELLERYKDRTIQPLFQPKNIREMCDFLEKYAPKTAEWPEETFKKLWHEVRGRHPENILVAVLNDFENWEVDRNIRTLTVRAYQTWREPRHHGMHVNPDHHEKEFMWEFRIKPDGSLVLRPFSNSASEKLYWTELSVMSALARLLREEFGYNGKPDERGERRRVTKRLLSRFHLIDADHHLYFKEPARAQTFSRHESEKFPHLMTCNQLRHGFIDFPPGYRVAWHHEPGTPNLFVPGGLDAPPSIEHISDLGLTFESLGLVA